MDYYQGVVTEYLRANRATFVNMECLIQLEPGDSPAKGKHWYCDAVAVNIRDKTAYLCEITYSKSLSGLIERLNNWSSQWPLIRIALARDCGIPADWHVQPKIFIPGELKKILHIKLPDLADDANWVSEMPKPAVIELEEVVPWKYRSWDRQEQQSL